MSLGSRSMRRLFAGLLLTLPMLFVLMAGSGTAAKDDTTLVSLAKVVPGGKANASSFSMSVSGNGRYVAFSTQANNLDAEDTGNDDDVYVRDTVAETTTLVTPGDGPGDGSGAEPAISDDGETVAFVSYDDLDPNDSNNKNDVYVADMTVDPPALSLASRPTGSGAGAPSVPDGASSPAISDDGNVVAFLSDDGTLDAANDSDTDPGTFFEQDVFVRELDTETTELVSRGATDGDRASYYPSLDADGSHVSFDTQASNLDAADVDEDRDVYVRDRVGNTLTLVSRADGDSGAKANDDAVGASLSADGDVVSFTSTATNLDGDDPDATTDVFVREIGAEETTLVSRASGAAGTKANKISQVASISADGTQVAFISAADNLDPAQSTPGSINHSYVRNLANDTTQIQSRADGGSGAIASNGVANTEISSDGTAIGFASSSTNLDALDTDAIVDAYVRDRSSGDTMLASQSPIGVPVNANGTSSNPSISADGRYIAFDSDATNLDPAASDTFSDIFVFDRLTGNVELASRATGTAGVDGNQSSRNPSISADGRFVAFESDAENLAADGDGEQDIFVRDLQNDSTTLVSLTDADQNVGTFVSEPSISGDGNRIAFESSDPYHPDDGNLLSDIYVRDLSNGSTVVASRPNGNTNLTGSDSSYLPEISDDGSSVAFESDADNITGISPVQQIVVRDIDANTTRLASRAAGAAGAIGDHESRRPTISSDGSRVAFHTDSTNLSPIDTTTQGKVIVRDLDTAETILASRADNGDATIGLASNGAISGDGTFVAFTSAANNLPNSSDTRPDVYVRDLLAGGTVQASRANGPSGAEGENTDDHAAISHYGRFVAFDSASLNLDPADTDMVRDVYLREMLSPDVTAPTSTINSGPASGSFNPQNAFTFNFAIDDPLATSECRIDGGAFASCSATFQTGQLADGDHTFEVRSTDRFDNLENPAKARSFTVDTASPDTLIDDGPSGAIADSNPSTSFRTTENGATFECSIDGAAFAACSSPLALGPLTDGDHGFEVRSVDRAGNVDASPAVRNFRVDTAITGRAIQAGKKQKVRKKKVKVRVTVRTGEKVTAKLTGTVTKGGGQLKKLVKVAKDGKQLKLVLKLKKKKGDRKVARKLKKGKKVVAKLAVTVTDGVGNARTMKKTVRLK